MMLKAFTAISEGHGDTALVLLKAGAEFDKKDIDGHLPIDLAPDGNVCSLLHVALVFADMFRKIRSFILRSADREGIDLSR